jgi:hypothetical protein
MKNGHYPVKMTPLYLHRQSALGRFRQLQPKLGYRYV